MHATQEGRKMREPGTEVGLETLPRDIVFYALMEQSLSKQFCKRLASLTECFFVPLAGIPVSRLRTLWIRARGHCVVFLGKTLKVV